MHFNGQTFSGVFEQFSFTSKFFGIKNEKTKKTTKKTNNNNNKQTNDFLKDKNAFESSYFFIKLTFR